MNEDILRNRISKFIIISYSIIFLSLIIFYVIFRGFDNEELIIITGYLSPITAIYLGALIKYAVANKNMVEEVIPKEGKKVNKLYVSITNWVIPSHFFLLFFFIFFAAINVLEFEQLKVLIPLVESVFGAYTGIIMSSLFKIDESVNPN